MLFIMMLSRLVVRDELQTANTHELGVWMGEKRGEREEGDTFRRHENDLVGSLYISTNETHALP